MLWLLVKGSGFGMISLSSLVLVHQYFNRRRAIAAAVAASGYSLGSLAAGPVVRLLIDEYAWRGTLTFISGMLLQVVVLGSLFRPLPAAAADISSRTTATSCAGAHHTNEGMRLLFDNDGLTRKRVRRIAICSYTRCRAIRI